MSTPQSMFKSMVLALAGMVLVYFGVGCLLTDRWHVDSSRTIPVAPERVGLLVRDFGTWASWSSMDANLGPQTSREVTGAPGTVGHCVTWTGNQGKAMLTMTEVQPGSIRYEFRGQRPEDPAPLLRGSGAVSWRAEGTGTHVAWHDESQWDNLPGRWIGWFGALQERVRQIQGTSLEGLHQALTQKAEPAAAPAQTK